MEFVPDAMGIDNLSLAAIILALLLSFGCIVMALIKR
jgi:hypothetical protein